MLVFFAIVLLDGLSEDRYEVYSGKAQVNKLFHSGNVQFQRNLVHYVSNEIHGSRLRECAFHC